jgi:hypothetical protein
LEFGILASLAAPQKEKYTSLNSHWKQISRFFGKLIPRLGSRQEVSLLWLPQVEFVAAVNTLSLE